MIPKIINYCWFGGNEIPEKDKKCIESWHKYCPDYEIKLWNEDNYDVSKVAYMREAYEAKKWGFVPDYARLDIIYNCGGIYLDTDVEIIKPIDELLYNTGFAAFEDGNSIALGLGFGAEKNNELIKLNMEIYERMHFFNEDGSMNKVASPVISKEVFEKYGFKCDNTKQTVNGFTIYPTDFFCPLDFRTNELIISDDTFSIHWYNASWFTERQKKEKRVEQNLRRKYGDFGSVLFKIYKYKNPVRLAKRIKHKDDVAYRE